MMHGRTDLLSHRDRRTLVAGGVTVLVLLLGVRGIPAWRAWVHATQSSAAALSARVAMARRDVAGRRIITRTADSLAQAYLALAPALLRGNTPAQASASLASYVSDAAAASGTHLGAVQLSVDSGAAHAELYKVSIRADVTGDVRGVTALLRTLEGGNAPLLAVRTLSISQSDPGAPTNHAEVLQVSIEVDGLGRTPVEP